MSDLGVGLAFWGFVIVLWVISEILEITEPQVSVGSIVRKIRRKHKRIVFKGLLPSITIIDEWILVVSNGHGLTGEVKVNKEVWHQAKKGNYYE